MEGSVRYHQRRLRFAVHLADARSEVVLWSEIYEQLVVDLFGVQRSIAADVARALRLELRGSAS